MASTFHVRSISLPSGCHPLAASVDEQLNRLRTSQKTSTSSISDLCHKLDGLKNLYECVDDFLQLPLIQQNLSISNEDVLNGSIKILDMCDISRDVLSQMKECLRQLESSLRRRTGVDEAISAYMITRKKIFKLVCKSLQNLKRSTQTKHVCSDQFKMLIEAEEISLAIFESLLSLISLPKRGSWSSVSKLFQPKRASCEIISEVQGFDSKLVLLANKKSAKDVCSLQSLLLRQSEDLNLRIQELEQNLECLYRRLLKTRVTLLNILNN